ncbi:hypothetical protein COCOBI_07-1640 [Coccomyxa sp. Obi]|nr:hypothetical protein COCOBI_07-1640 [Coccomyxa sp. Obi]
MADAEHVQPSISKTTRPPIDNSVLKAPRSSKEELVQRVEGLKKDLADWRVRLNSQVEQYQMEMGGLRTQLMTEMEALRSEFLDMRVSLQQQLDATWTAVDSAEQAPVPQQEKQAPGEQVEA